MKDEDILEGEIEGTPEPVAAAPVEREYELQILAISYDPSHTQAYVEFKALGAPVFSYSAVKDGPILRAVVDIRSDPSKRLSAGGGSALATRVPVFVGGEFGSSLELPPVEGVPDVRLDEGAVREACRRTLSQHIAAAREENARAEYREKQESLVGTRFKLKV